MHMYMYVCMYLYIKTCIPGAPGHDLCGREAQAGRDLAAVRGGHRAGECSMNAVIETMLVLQQSILLGPPLMKV